MAKNTTTQNPAPKDQALKKESPSQLPLRRINFILMAIAAAMIVIGFALTSGGASETPDQFNPEIFSVRRLIVGPNIAFLGYIFMGLGIMWPSRKNSDI